MCLVTRDTTQPLRGLLGRRCGTLRLGDPTRRLEDDGMEHRWRFGAGDDLFHR